jgi:MarR family transcriptional regulator, lower aerobic nicotinate degradation pathway regulator
MDTADDLRDSLVQVSFAVTALLSRVAAEQDLSLTQLRVLGTLRDRERSTVSGLIDRAAQRGLVRKTTHPDDARSVRVSLTAEAQSLATLVIAGIGELMAPLTDRLNSSEQKRLTVLLGNLLDR